MKCRAAGYDEVVELAGVLCPKCNGQGHVTVPPWVPGDQPSWFSSTTTSYRCQVCKGAGIVVLGVQRG